RTLDYIALATEMEALILESHLIKQYHPRFNIQLKDDKKYPYLKVTPHEFPALFLTRQVANDGSRYFGPYTSVGYVRRALEVVKRQYTVRSCRYDLPGETPSRPCLDHHIGRCQAPCVGLQTEADYRVMIDEILRLLEGDTEGVRRLVEQRMKDAAARLDFETAARHRDVLQGLDTLAREQRVDTLGGGDVDVFGVARDGAVAAGVVLRMRRGRLIGRDVQRFQDLAEETDPELVQSLATRHYLGRGEVGLQDLPRDVLLPLDFEDADVLAGVLAGSAGRHVALKVPERGQKRRLVELAGENARHSLEERVTATTEGIDRADRTLYDLQAALGLKVVPRLIVCFDISHLQGTDTVASAVVFENGAPKKSDYRRMRIRGEWGNDDFLSMEEAVRRWFRRRQDEEQPLPDLALIDGGKGQLGAARRALEEMGFGDLPVAALAKREEEVFLPGRTEPVRLDPRQRALHLLQRIRNEAHRFAISYNRKLRRRRTLTSELRDVPGIGERRQRALLERFGSIRGLKNASEEEIARVPGMSRALASRVLTWLAR
ncbi:MAG: excinuclease ABC subunit UvrC, partial [Gemmatimonadetes bacterium]|nr:excinuclease ABC subunit UvrC [Gemmatimonadota bacterium]